MDSINYKELYSLQDKVLKVVFETEHEFYLTGGTCLSRFYIEKRYSDDLDFFANASARYSFAIKNIRLALQKSFRLSIEVASKDFTRFRVDDILQVDFVNDISYRHKEPIVNEAGFLLDNIENILANKITAVIGRDNPKDIFDIYLIWKHYHFEWVDIFTAAHKKAAFCNDELIIRLKSFPRSLLDVIKVTDSGFLQDFAKEYPEIIQGIIDGVSNEN